MTPPSGLAAPSASSRARRRNLDPAESELEFAWPVDLRLAVMSHGWALLAPWSWDREAGRLAHIERIGGRLGAIAVVQRDPFGLTVRAEGFVGADLPEILRRVRRWVSAEWDPAPAISALRPGFPEEAALIARGGGRILRCSTFYEDFVKTVLTINTSWSSTCRMAAALVEEPGGGAFPTPEAVLDYGEVRLRKIAKLGFRAPVIIEATRRMLGDGAIDAAGRGAEDRLGHDYLTSLKGIGPYAAAHCRILLQDFSRVPIDTVAVADLRDRLGQDPAEFAACFAGCGDYLALAYKLGRLRHKLAQAEAL